MRLLYVTPYFAPAWAYGGPPRVTYDMARQLVRRGHAVDVLTTDALDADGRLPAGATCLDGVSVWRSRNLSNRLAWKYNVFLPLSFGAQLRQALETADVVHLFGFRSYQSAVVVRELRRRVPYVVSAFGQMARAAGPKRPVKVLFDLLWGHRLLREASALIAQTEDEVRWYRRFGGQEERIHQVPLAVDLGELGDPPERGTFRRALGIGESEVVVLFLGRIHPYKGLDVLLRAFAEVRARREYLRLVIAGRDDGYLAAARTLGARLAPEGSVLFPGPVYGKARFAAYQDADVFAITPSEPEQTSLAALEACACGTPVLVSEQASIPGLEAAQAGLIVPHDAAAVARALARLVDSAGERARMGQRAARLVRERFSWEGVIAELERVYDQVRVGNW